MDAYYEDRDDGSGWAEFAAVLLFAVGFFRIISAIAYFADSHKVNDLSHGLFSGHTWGWGVWDLIIAALAIFAGISLIAGRTFGRVVAYIWAVVTIVQCFTIINISPWFAALTIALCAMVIYGLATSPRAKAAA
jgi:hypothetical protein